MKPAPVVFARAAVAALSLAAAWFMPRASGATTTTWEISGYTDFLRGRMSGLSLTRDGRLTLGPKIDPLYSSDQAQIWSVARAPNGSLYLGTGNRGRLIKIDPSGNGTVVWSSDQPEIFAVAVDKAGVVYAGTSPQGKVYRIENGEASEYFAPGEAYIWALAIAPDGALYVGTGQQGKIYRVTGPGRGYVYYETGQAHVTALAFDREGRLLAGSEPNGLLYRITGTPAKGFVLYDANLPEIRTIVPAADGSIYAAALGGSVARRAAAAASTTSSTPVLTAPATSITVTAQAEVVPPPKPEPAKPPAATPPVVSAPATTAEATGVEKSALYRIFPDNTVETLWTSKEENIYDVLADGSGTLTFLTDGQGRVYRIDPRTGRPREATLIAQTNEGDAMRLAESAGGLLVAAGNAGKMLRLETSTSASGWYESPVHDAGTVARWGRLSWTGSGNGISFRTRSGNSARPDATWSDWSAPITGPANSLITSPNARYLQWRAEMTGPSGAEAGAAPVGLASVTVAYLPQNTAPSVRSITVTAQPANAAKPTTTSPAVSSAFSITVTDSGDASTPAGTQSQTFPRPAGQQLQISWQADDPEGDRLIYDLYFRGEDEREWKLLRAGITENTYSVDGDALADGRYYFRVVASDRLSNPPDQARQAELIGAPVLIDNTPPQVSASAPRRNGNTLEIDVDAQDRTSPLRRCEYNIDAGPWQPVEAADGVTDSPREQFHIRIENLAPGEHSVVIRTYDAAGNAGLARVLARP